MFFVERTWPVFRGKDKAQYFSFWRNISAIRFIFGKKISVTLIIFGNMVGNYGKKYKHKSTSSQLSAFLLNY